MYRYSRTDFDRVLEFVNGLYEPRTPEALSDHLLPALSALVPNVFVGALEVVAGQQAGTTRTDPAAFVSAELDEIAARYMPTSAIAVHFERTRSEQFMRWSDLQPLSQFLRTALYNEAYRSLGVRDCCSFLSRPSPTCLEIIGVTLHKRFPDAHRDILVSISPHLSRAFRLAHTTSALIEMAAMKGVPNCSARGVVAIDLDGTITTETSAATRSLEKFFGMRTMRGLPEQLARWISDSAHTLRNATDVPEVRHPFVIERDGERLTVHLFSKPAQNFLVLEEHRSALDPEALSSLPLTHRQAEILAYIALGKTNPEIGIILGISWRTVSRHVEHILDALGVDTRTAAAASALEAANL